MSQDSATLVANLPGFAEQALSATERRQGAVEAWREAWQRDPVASVRTARGHFAVGLSEGGRDGFLAVDRFATESMCYAVRDGKLAFSTRADALAGGSGDIDPQSIFDYLYFHAIPSPRTIFRGVHRLPPGHCLQFKNGQAQVQRYWSPGFAEQHLPLATRKDEFLGLIRQAVARQLDGSRPACFLSGGTDSSTVAGLIGEVAGRPAATYSIGFEAEGYDEMAFARIAARHFGTDHHEYYVTPADLVRSIPEMARYNDQPFGNSSALPAYYCALQAKGDGVTRLLAGDGGDELFGGNTRYATQRVLSWYQSLPEALRRRVLEPLTDAGALDGLPGVKKLASYVRQARVPMPDRLQTYNLLGRVGQARVLTPAFLAQVDDQGPARQEREVWAESEGASLVNRMLAFDWRYTLAENDLPKVRQATELAGVTVGYPMLDQDLVDFSSRLATGDKLRGLKLRWFFKEALRGFLPDEIITKKKQGFGLPFGVWATRDEALKALAVDSVRGLAARGLVREDFAREVFDHFLPAHPGYYGSMVWILMMLEQWFRHHAPDYRVAD